MKTIYREKRYYCGEYLDVYIFPTSGSYTHLTLPTILLV